MKQRLKEFPFLTIVVVILIFSMLIFCAIPVYDIVAGLIAYRNRIAEYDDYSLYTSPLPVETIEDLCNKLDGAVQGKYCKPDAVVYSPELFDDIRRYFFDLPDQEANYENVNYVLGPYLVSCENPISADGNYRCVYDLRGDGVYRIGFYFDINDHIYKIGDNRGGS